jgi:hypothetical protein
MKTIVSPLCIVTTVMTCSGESGIAPSRSLQWSHVPTYDAAAVQMRITDFDLDVLG